MTDPIRASGAVHSLGEATRRLHDKWGAIVAIGVLMILLGAAATVFALAATKATVVVNGVVFLIAGAAEIGVGMQAQAWAKFFLWVIGGLLYLVVGLICLFNPTLAASVLTLMLGAALIAAGVVRLYVSFQLPSDQRGGMVLLAGGVTTLLGVIVVAHWPADSVFVLGTLLGIDLLFNGIGWLGLGLGLRARR